MPGIMVWELLYSIFKSTTMKKHFESIGGVFIMLGTVAVLAFTRADDAFLFKVSQANVAEIAAGTQLADHEVAVLLFEAESTSGTDADAIANAKKYLPKLKMHLRMFQSGGSLCENS